MLYKLGLEYIFGKEYVDIRNYSATKMQYLTFSKGIFSIVLSVGIRDIKVRLSFNHRVRRKLTRQNILRQTMSFQEKECIFNRTEGRVNYSFFLIELNFYILIM